MRGSLPAEEGRIAGKAFSKRHAYVVAVAVCAFATASGWLLEGRLDLSNVILLYVLAVAYVAARCGRGPAVLLSCLAVLCFNVFFVPPRFSLTVADPQYILTFAVMLAVSLVISYLSNAYRDKAIEAERRAGEAGLLHDLARDLSAALDLQQAARLAAEFVRRQGGRGASLFVAGADEVLRSVDEAGDPGKSHVLELAAARAVYASGCATGAVAPLHGDDATRLLPLEGATRRRGVLAVYLDPAETEPEERLLVSAAALVATAVERIHYVEVAQASEVEARSVRLRNSILAAISHDIRTPLTVLFGQADSLSLSEEVPPPQREAAAALRTQAYRLHRMVDNLLDMARLQSGRVELRLDWESIPEIAAAAVQSLQPALAAHPLRFDWPADLPLLRLDAMLMERVFCNLLENAAKYAAPGTPVRLAAACADGELSIWIANDGGGFPPDRIERVFDLFERGVAVSKTGTADSVSGGAGVGVGLSICRTIVEAHGGTIHAANIPGGAEVRITLPCGEAPPMPHGDAALRSHGEAARD